MLNAAQTSQPLDLPLLFEAPTRKPARPGLVEDLAGFREFGQPTRIVNIPFTDPAGHSRQLPAYVNEFWTARQRQASSLHEISYRACFKPQLPRFFIERLTQPGEIVYDPFMGRGTTPLEAALLARIPYGNDANPLSLVMTRPRLNPPVLAEVEARLNKIPLDRPADTPADLLVFYHPTTLRGISSLKRYLLKRRADGLADAVDDWIAVVALNRLTGHSNGFFSVYTLPPNQATSSKAQTRINLRRNQTPPERDLVAIILKKTRQLLGDVDQSTRETLARVRGQARFFTGPADATPGIPSGAISLVVTSPPFLNVVQYATDNWLRCWFLGIDAKSVNLTVPSKLVLWQQAMTAAFLELHRLLKPGGHIAFEVGEIHGGETRLEEAVLPCGLAAGLQAVLVVINDQKFTKTANCWGIHNMAKGTNTNRIVLFRKA